MLYGTDKVVRESIRNTGIRELSCRHGTTVSVIRKNSIFCCRLPRFHSIVLPSIARVRHEGRAACCPGGSAVVDSLPRSSRAASYRLRPALGLLLFGCRQSLVIQDSSFLAIPRREIGLRHSDRSAYATQSGTGRGANDADDLIDLSLTVLDHANASFSAVVDQDVLMVDLGQINRARRFRRLNSRSTIWWIALAIN